MLTSGWYILGNEVAAFEEAFATYIGCQFSVGVASGTDALVLALRAIGVGAGDYVAVPSHTAVATVAAIELTGARPLLIDIDPATYTLDVQAFADALAQPVGRISAVIPVHLYGQCGHLEAIVDLARRCGVRVIEDCAQCHGATLGTRRLGTFGDMAAFSFYPTKNLGAFGDGGAVVTADKKLAENVRMLREYGWRTRYVSDIAGVNSRLDELQAAVLNVKLGTLEADNARRQAIAAAYDFGLKQSGLGLPARHSGSTHVFHQYVVRSTHRQILRSSLRRLGIATNIHYPIPVHLQPAYEGRVAIGPAGLRESERAASEVLSLPIYPELADVAVSQVISGVLAQVQEID
ncbi:MULTISPECIES: DegT/DnrJ/EryC1/StrS family aminotransferase [unclassified Bradyrhizobium]|uniref:DegT/DnrJ/EryC1/StrS family aminotransferase n=1 Tax=unclassified Bradyrhizobium TaxID=2631580 RepID=UPI002478F0F8|nr:MULTISPECIES: DegT/DnrJ/EryC1/StrS family aminotransferase [unclassified Bradyrhizobium]WGR68664.1 DegT/DnrJ/EryC1/StrS family aminotransferase [Bradyrhizobium sp. ISRA426]WGR80719.1 DegT/DnrJ/EryC1/StrS family aminotransferase [Bradyrhizobium sp. ISRA430]WGR83904.1 DegT/DnrJ/EryC1/StrS family aminotransferase [Bradyrhizobium sp. ISRA432]